MNVSTELARGLPLNFSVVNDSLNMIWNNSDVNDWLSGMIGDAQDGYGVDLSALDYVVSESRDAEGLVDQGFDMANQFEDGSFMAAFLDNFAETFKEDECATEMIDGQPKYDRSEMEFDYMYYKNVCTFFYDCMGEYASMK